jgi:hypothetical protein
MKTHYDKAHFDKLWLYGKRKLLTCAQIDSFIERVGIKQDSGIPEETARQQSYEEIFA